MYYGGRVLKLKYPSWSEYNSPIGIYHSRVLPKLTKKQIFNDVLFASSQYYTEFSWDVITNNFIFIVDHAY
jgi:hypothetical protein